MTDEPVQHPVPGQNCGCPVIPLEQEECWRSVIMCSEAWATEALRAEDAKSGMGMVQLGRIRSRFEAQFREALTAVLADAYPRVDNAINERSTK